MILFIPINLLPQQLPDRYKSVAPREGERCIICDVPLDDEDVTLLVRGRRVPLKRAMLDSFMNNQEKYFARLQPKSALFQENLTAPLEAAQGGISLSWFFVGLYVLTGLIFGGLCAYSAVSKGLAPIVYFFVGFLFNVFGYLYVFSRKPVVKKGEIPAGLVKVPITQAPISCKQCGEDNHPSANKCSSCGAKLEPSMQSEVGRS